VWRLCCLRSSALVPNELPLECATPSEPVKTRKAPASLPTRCQRQTHLRDQKSQNCQIYVSVLALLRVLQRHGGLIWPGWPWCGLTEVVLDVGEGVAGFQHAPDTPWWHIMDKLRMVKSAQRKNVVFWRLGPFIFVRWCSCRKEESTTEFLDWCWEHNDFRWACWELSEI
jgi:hypothetical protein